MLHTMYSQLSNCNLQQIICNDLFAMTFFINRHECHIIIYEVKYESSHISEMTDEDRLKIGQRLTDEESGDRK